MKLILAMVAAFIVTGSPVDAQVSLAWKFEPGASFRVTHHLVQTLALETKNKPFRHRNTIDLVTRWRVRDVDAQGAIASLVIAVESMRNTSAVEDRKTAVASKDDELWEGAVFVARVDPQGRVLAIAGYDRLLEKLARGNAARQRILAGLKPVESFQALLQTAMGPLPARAVQPGDSWMQRTVETLWPLGSFEHTTSFRYAGIKEFHLVEAVTRTAFKGPPGPLEGDIFRVKDGDIKPDAKTGHFLFDAARGRLVAAQRQGKLRGTLALEGAGDVQRVTFECDSRLTVNVECGASDGAELEWIRVGDDRRGFVLESSKKPFVPWGFNYDHDDAGRLIEDYWEKEWAAVEGDFREMKQLGANVVRIHLQVAKFLDGPETANRKNLERLGKLLKLAQDTGLYLDLTGLGCYHKADVPPWYDKLSEEDRWKAQAFFWEAVAKQCAASPAVFCYDLMNEPVVPGGKRKSGDWLGPAFGGKHFVQVISLDQAGRPRPEIARAWIKQLVAAIRKHDRRHLVTVGLVDWSLDKKGLTSGFVPSKIHDDLDFLCVHLYPQTGKVEEALETLKGFNVGKPVVIEETFPLRSSWKEFERFMDESRQTAAGWIGFYWGKPPEELRKSNQFAAAIMLRWLEYFAEKARKMRSP